MAGAYRMALSRADLVVARPGAALETHTNLTVSVRDGVAKARTGSRTVAEMPVATLDQDGRRSYTITGTDGTVWTVTKDCGCGSR